MTDRRMFYAVDPLAAYLVTRDGQVPGEAPEVVVHARRGGLPGRTAVEVRVIEDELRPGERPGQFAVPRTTITPERIGRAFQPWHVDVELPRATDLPLVATAAGADAVRRQGRP